MQMLHPFAGPIQRYFDEIADPDRYRPDHCPQCGAKHPLTGHGFYYRTLVDAAFDGVIRVRRYLCRSCKRTVSLLPEFVLPWLRFSISVIALFLQNPRGWSNQLVSNDCWRTAQEYVFDDLAGRTARAQYISPGLPFDGPRLAGRVIKMPSRIKIKRLERYHSICYLRGALQLRSNNGYPCLCGGGLPAVAFSATSQTRPIIKAVALRQQLAVFKRKQPQPKLDRLDRLFCIALLRLWEGSVKGS